MIKAPRKRVIIEHVVSIKYHFYIFEHSTTERPLSIFATTIDNIFSTLTNKLSAPLGQKNFYSLTLRVRFVRSRRDSVA